MSSCFINSNPNGKRTEYPKLKDPCFRELWSFPSPFFVSFNKCAWKFQFSPSTSKLVSQSVSLSVIQPVSQPVSQSSCQSRCKSWKHSIVTWPLTTIALSFDSDLLPCLTSPSLHNTLVKVTLIIRTTDQVNFPWTVTFWRTNARCFVVPHFTSSKAVTAGQITRSCGSHWKLSLISYRIIII